MAFGIRGKGRNEPLNLSGLSMRCLRRIGMRESACGLRGASARGAAGSRGNSGRAALSGAGVEGWAAGGAYGCC